MNGLEVFSGFKPAIEACFLDWEDYQIPGITYNTGAAWLYHTQPFTCFRHTGETARSDHATINPVSFISTYYYVKTILGKYIKITLSSKNKK